jgi:hypothetical protein
MYELFGLKAAPWHAASMVVHIININLFFVLLRRVGVGAAAALAATALFAVSVAFFHVIAWVSCIQQLMGQSFLLASLIWGFDYIERGVPGRRWLSLAAYVLALGCVEQTFGAPVLLLGFFFIVRRDGAGRGLRSLVRKLSPHFAMMVVYLLFFTIWKKSPSEGYYAFHFGTNITVNLVTYLGWTLQFWAALPSRMAIGRIDWSIIHLLAVFLVLYQVLRGRWREAAFAVLYFVVTISPALFLKNHTFYLHTYIPAFGLLYLLAHVFEDAFGLRRLRPVNVKIAVLSLVIISVSAGSFEMVRRNERYNMFNFIEMQRSFVLRRASIARAVYSTINAEKPFAETTEKVHMVYAREEGRDKAMWNRKNVVSATGNGSLINLIYGRPDLEVVFGTAGDEIPWEEQFVSDIYFFDDFGNCVKMIVAGETAEPEESGE